MACNGDTFTFTFIYSLNFLKPVYVQNVHLVPQYTPNNDVEQSDIPSGLLLMIYHWLHVQSDLSVPPVFVILWRTPCSLKFPEGRSLEGLIREIEAETTMHFLFVLSISDLSTHLAPFHDFILIWDSFYCYPCWCRCTNFNPPTSLNLNNILHFPITLQYLLTLIEW